MNKNHPARCSQIIYPHGVGALVIGKSGASFIVAGLDAWFNGDDNAHQQINENEFVINEYRLQQLLQVNHFRLPPDYRELRRGILMPNSNLTIPVLQFPQWHACPRCDRMEFLPLTLKEKPFCDFCREDGITLPLSQMPFIALCEGGHLQDFPWREWAHRQHRPACAEQLSYLRSGGSTLAGQKVKCECGATRSLAGIDRAWFSETYLTLNLSRREGFFLCRGHRPWLGEIAEADCDRHLRGNLRGAGNVWFARTLSAIFLPKNSEIRARELRNFLNRTGIAAQIKSLQNFGETNITQLLRIFYPDFLNDFTDSQIAEAMPAVNQNTRKNSLSANKSGDGSESKTVQEDDETEFRFDEYQILREEQDDEVLLSRRITLNHNSPILAKNFSRLVLIHRLRETRVFTGFSRIFSDNLLPLEERKKMLRRRSTNDVDGDDAQPNAHPTDWLPATTVFGEGIFLELDEQRLQKWETQFAESLEIHIKPVVTAYRKARRENSGRGENLSARFILIHTLAHLLIGELTFECGYSAAALRERLYVSERKSSPMAGLLIYTADGDCEGTLGGLVQMGNPEALERILARALDKAKWRASDPICVELGAAQGQGPDSCNLAACHSCALLPETACEEFNRFLDREIIVGISAMRRKAFFDFNS